MGATARSSFRLPMTKGGELIFRGAKTTIKQVRREADATVAKPEPKPKTPDPKTEPAPKAVGPFAEVAQLKASKTLAGLNVAIAPDGKRAAMVSSTAKGKTNTVAIWDLAENKIVQRIRP
jgi:hypothetical protein